MKLSAAYETRQHQSANVSNTFIWAAMWKLIWNRWYGTADMKSLSLPSSGFWTYSFKRTIQTKPVSKSCQLNGEYPQQNSKNSRRNSGRIILKKIWKSCICERKSMSDFEPHKQQLEKVKTDDKYDAYCKRQYIDGAAPSTKCEMGPHHWCIWNTHKFALFVGECREKFSECGTDWKIHRLEYDGELSMAINKSKEMYFHVDAVKKRCKIQAVHHHFNKARKNHSKKPLRECSVVAHFFYTLLSVRLCSVFTCDWESFSQQLCFVFEWNVSNAGLDTTGKRFYDAYTQ